jgi:putative membrane protein
MPGQAAELGFRLEGLRIESRFCLEKSARPARRGHRGFSHTNFFGADMQGLDGFLGTRATFMLDVVVLAMVAIAPTLAWSIYQVRYRRRYTLHKRVQLLLGTVLLVTVVLFEIDMRVNGWRDRASVSPYLGQDGGVDWVDLALGVHLCFAISAALLWVVVIARALRSFANPPAPGPHSAWHRRFGYLAAIDMFCTALTGWIFYWLAFVA